VVQELVESQVHLESVDKLVPPGRMEEMVQMGHRDLLVQLDLQDIPVSLDHLGHLEDQVPPETRATMVILATEDLQESKALRESEVNEV
jgi:hypothetical protein